MLSFMYLVGSYVCFEVLVQFMKINEESHLLAILRVVLWSLLFWWILVPAFGLWMLYDSYFLPHKWQRKKKKGLDKAII